MAGQILAIAGVEQDPRSNKWNFVNGVSAAYNQTTKAWDLTVGVAGSAHTIQDEGVSLTQRATLNFVGVNVAVTDAGGKTVVTIGAVSLAGSGVSGVLPVARGGTGLGALGTALQQLRVNAAGTALEYFTPSAGGGGGAGGGMSFPFTYSSTTTDADPGAGTFRGNNAALASAGQLFFDDLEYGGTTVSSWLATFDDAITTGKGTLRLQSKADPTKWLEFPITAYTSATGYSKITVGASRGPGGITTTAGDTQVIFDAAATGTVKSLSYDAEIDNPTTTIDWTTGALQKKTIGAGSVTLAFTAPPAFTPIQLRLIQDGTGGRALPTLPGNVLLVGGIPYFDPTATTGELVLAGYYDGTNYRFGAGIPNTLPARGQENVALDLYPSFQGQGAINTGGSVTFNVALTAGKRYKIVADVWVDDGAGGVCRFAKAIAVVAHITGGAAVLVTNDATHDNQGAGFSFAATASTTNVVFTLGNTSGTNRTYNVVIGSVSLDKP